MTKQDIGSRKDLFIRAIKGRAGVFSLLAKSLFELAKIMLETGNNTVVALQKLKEAEKIFKKAGAKSWVKKVEKLTEKR